MAMGYANRVRVASPTIQYTGRLATDPLGVMQQETAVDLPTVGSQTDMDRWGDYSAMQVDPPMTAPSGTQTSTSRMTGWPTGDPDRQLGTRVASCRSRSPSPLRDPHQ